MDNRNIANLGDMWRSLFWFAGAVFFFTVACAVCLIEPKAELLLDNANETSRQVKLLSIQSRAFSEDQAKKFNDPKTQESIGLWLRTGNEAAKTADNIVKLTRSADALITNANGLVERVREETVPRVNRTADEASEGILRSTKGVAEVSRASVGMIDAGTKAIDTATFVLADPKIDSILEHVDNTMTNLDSLSQMAAMNAPAFFANVNDFTYHTAGVAEEMHKFGQGVNKKHSFLSKLASIGLTAALGNIRSIK